MSEISSNSRPVRARIEARRETLAWVMAAGLLWLLYLVAGPFLSPLIWASVLAIFFYPVHRRLRDGIGKRNVAALLSMLAVALSLVLPVVLLAPAFVGQTAQVIADLPTQDIVDRIERGFEFLSARLPPAVGDLGQTLEEGVSALRNRVGGWSAKLIGNLAEFILDFIVLLLALFYLFGAGTTGVGLFSVAVAVYTKLVLHDPLFVRALIGLLLTTMGSMFLMFAMLFDMQVNEDKETQVRE